MTLSFALCIANYFEIHDYQHKICRRYFQSIVILASDLQRSGRKHFLYSDLGQSEWLAAAAYVYQCLTDELHLVPIVKLRIKI